MSPNPKVVRAFRAMKDIGIPEEKVKPVLKNLLNVFEKNWELIEDENYRALADAIFETEEAQEAENKKNLVDTEREVDFEEEAQEHEEPERPLKRLRLRHQDGQPSPSVSNSSPSLGGTLLKKPKVEGSDLNSEKLRIESEPVSPQSLSRKKGKQPVSPNSQPSVSPIRLRDRGKEPLLPQIASGEKRANCERSSNAVIIKEPKVEPGITLSPKQKVPATRALIKPKDEPVTDGIPQFEVLIAVIHPEPLSKGNSSIANGSNGESHGPEPLTSQSIDAVDKNDEIEAPSIETGPSCKHAKIPDESSANLEIASSPSGELKISLTWNSALGRPDFHMPSLDSVLKAMEDKCLRSYKVLDPKFSVTKLMKDMLEAVGTEGTVSSLSNGSENIQCDAKVVLPQIPRVPPPCNSVDDGAIDSAASNTKTSFTLQ